MGRWSSSRDVAKPQVTHEALANVRANVVMVLPFLGGLIGVLLASVSPIVLADRGAISDLINAIEAGALTYELHPGDTSVYPAITPEECDAGWYNASGIVRWSGAASAPRMVQPRGELTLPVAAYDVSAGLTRRLGVVPGPDEVMVGAAYADEAGLRTGSALIVDGREASAVVVEPPGELRAYQRAVLVPGAGFPAESCIIGLEPAVWRTADQALDVSLPERLGDWFRRCVACDQLRVSEVAHVAGRRPDLWPIGIVGAFLLGVLYVVVRRSDLALYRLVGFGRSGAAGIATLEAFLIGVWAAVTAMFILAVVMTTPPVPPRDITIRYPLLGAGMVAAWVVGVAFAATAISERRVVAALRG